MRAALLWLAACILVVSVAGFSGLMFQVDAIDRRVALMRGDLLPRDLAVKTTNPIEVQVMQPGQPTITLSKDVEGIGHIAYPCAKLPTETFQEFGARCASEFAAICEGLEE